MAPDYYYRMKVRNTPRAMKKAESSFRGIHWQTIYKVVIPFCIWDNSQCHFRLGHMGWETAAVLMVTGNAAVIPYIPFSACSNNSATIAADRVKRRFYVPNFALGCILFKVLLGINMLVE
jgi:phosphate transport system permease protein